MTVPTSVHRILAAVVVVVAGLIAATGPTAAHYAGDKPAVIVEVDVDGSAVVSVRSAFDLTSEAEREAFRALADDPNARQRATDRFRERMRAVASDAENATGREMAVSAATIDLRESQGGDVGIVRLSVTWEGLAARDGDALVVTEPFASGYTPDRSLVVHAPEGYEIASATPRPDTSVNRRAIWGAGADLSGFAVELRPAPSTEADAVGTPGQPGFGIPVAALALVLTVTTWRRYRRADRPPDGPPP